jgi:hypothetical protein
VLKDVFSCGGWKRSIDTSEELDLAVCLSKKRTCANCKAIEILSTDVDSRVDLSKDKKQ